MKETLLVTSPGGWISQAVLSSYFPSSSRSLVVNSDSANEESA